jgi:quinate dehydrogenase
MGQIKAMSHVDSLTEEAKAIGSINTIYVSSVNDESNSPARLVGTNTDCLGVRNAIHSAVLKDLPPTTEVSPSCFEAGVGAAFILGGGGTTRAAVYALHKLDLSPIYLVNRDSQETAQVVNNFPNVSLIPLISVDQARDVLADPRTPPFFCAVGAIPAIAPETEAEKTVCAITQILLGRKYELSLRPSNVAHRDPQPFLPVPSKPVFLEMPYIVRVLLLILGIRFSRGSLQPLVTPTLKAATEAGWLPLNVSMQPS